MNRALLAVIAATSVGCSDAPPSFADLCDRIDAECADVSDDAIAECHDNAGQYDALFIDTECEEPYVAWLECLQAASQVCVSTAEDCAEEQELAHDCNDARS